jgi:CheY-like chemotaxis protein
MGPPQIERCPTLYHKFVPLIDGRNARNRTSLVVEDLVGDMGGDADIEVLTAEDGEKGCAMAAAERPDIILMDLEMRNVDGWEATQRLKGNPETRDIPIIALSAHALAGSREKALAAGCDEFDTKPIEFDRLVATVRRVLAARK